MIKDIVVNIPLRAEGDKTTRYAASMAGYFNAHISGVAFEYEPLIAGVEFGLAAVDSLNKQKAEAKALAKGAVERFEFEIRRENVPSSTRQIEAAPEEAPRLFAQIAHSHDVAVVAQSDPDRPSFNDLFAEAALFESGRPVVIVPYIQAANFKVDRVVIAWDGSRPATRAVADAMPFLRRAASVDLVTIVGDNAEPDELPGVDMAEHLARHGLKVKAHRIPMAEEVAPSILNFIADNDIDFAVMGGYGHSRVREFILGGATRGMLQSMTVPTLMSH